MGSCATKDQMITPRGRAHTYQDKQSAKITNNTNSSSDQSHIFGIVVNQSKDKSLAFNHSPLRYCEFLFDKFKKSDCTPKEVSLGFMLTTCKVLKNQRSIQIGFINNTKMKIWCIYGGIQKVSDTGLTVEINNYKSIQHHQISKPNNKASDQSTQQLFFSFKLSQTPRQNILIILQPQISSDQTLFMIYRYQIIPNEKQYTLITQSLQWSSLAFIINDIYGSEHLFKLNDSNQICSICLTNNSQCILLPCRHMCVCQSCLEQVEKTSPRCPLCRKQYYSVIKYKSDNI